MSRNRDNSRVPHTCPIIDNVVGFLNSIDWDDNENDLEKECRNVLSILEDIRTANLNLREWGNDEYKRANEAEDELSDAKSIISDLQSEIIDLKQEIKELNK